MDPGREAQIRARWATPPTGRYPETTERLDYADVADLLEELDRRKRRADRLLELAADYEVTGEVIWPYEVREILDPPEEEILPCPECRQGKHGNCSGRSWSNDLDREVECPCTERGGADHG